MNKSTDKGQISDFPSASCLCVRVCLSVSLFVWVGDGDQGEGSLRAALPLPKAMMVLAPRRGSSAGRGLSDLHDSNNDNGMCEEIRLPSKKENTKS